MVVKANNIMFRLGLVTYIFGLVFICIPVALAYVNASKILVIGVVAFNLLNLILISKDLNKWVFSNE